VLADGGTKGTGIHATVTLGVEAVTTNRNGAALHAYGISGRGVVTEGSSAQLRLVPGSARSHNRNGQPGDLFVDSANRFWFCKGKTAWVRLA
jgi:hypothetical protein